MKRYLLFIALLGLGFGACKKEEAAKPSIETIKIAGHEYPKDSTFTVFSKYSGLPLEGLKFLQDEEVFIYNDYLKVLPSDYLILKK
ncbi:MULTISPECIES: hypothetical protein [Sphingobacterium]|uniref:Lipoprotein n=1 Tax=Sphingobacterium ginsenosidimutans TaxID=687845 RepID=A0ABP8A5G9_9SPHI|nr:hypothetical protein [Sphingobacterium sp. E70]ULT24941.1 hypothetical protein KUH03_39710 [Sphingobacterium sp. E70]